MDENSDTYFSGDPERRREAALKVMLATPHKPHKPTGLTPAKKKAPKREKPAERPKRPV